MRLGFLTAPFPDTPLAEVADWAADNGFESLEIACWPRATGESRRYAGTSHIDVTNLLGRIAGLSQVQADQALAEFVDAIAGPSQTQAFDRFLLIRGYRHAPPPQYTDQQRLIGVQGSGKIWAGTPRAAHVCPAHPSVASRSSVYNSRTANL